MIKIERYYEPIKNEYVDILYAGSVDQEPHHNDIKKAISTITKADVEKLKDDKGYIVTLASDTNPFSKCKSFTFTTKDYVIFDRKKKVVRVLSDTSKEINDFFEDHLEI